jgi:RNA polymerase sigma-70 factor (ECF subfamily)
MESARIQHLPGDMEATQDPAALALSQPTLVDSDRPSRESGIRPVVGRHVDPSRPMALATESRIRRMLAQYFDLVWRTACRLGAPVGRADDIAQEVFLVVARRLDHIDSDRERSFLIGVTVRLTANVRRAVSAKAELADELNFERHVDPSPQPDELLDQMRLRAVLDEILSLLPTEQREVFVLSEIEGLSGPEVAAALGLPIGTVASRLHRARARFKTHVGRFRARSGAKAGGMP